MAREDFVITGPKPVGRGSFGTVFAATRVADDQPVALKLVLHSGEWGVERIEAERKGAILQQRFARAHGMVPAVYDFGPDGDDFYIAMEFIDGTSLEGLLRQGRLPPAAAAGHASWVCGFLEKAHAFSGVVDGRSYRIVHTDLKPAHLMISPSGDRRVLDFGIAKALEESRELGTDIGRTIAYASPERLVSDQVSPHADFWSLGVMLFEMVCGHRPYPHLDGPRFRRELEQAITANAPRAPFPDSCPPELGAIISKLLAFQVEHRYPSAEAIKADLEMFLRGETPTALTIYETPATTPVHRISGGGAALAVPLARALPQAAAAVVEPSPATTPRPQSHAIAATEPRPAAAAATVAAGVEVADAVAIPVVEQPAVAARVTRWPDVRRLVPALAMLCLVVVVASEGVAWIFAERFRDTMLIDERTVTESRRAYRAVDRLGLLDLGLRARVHGRLLQALVAVGDRVIADYRREEPDMGPSEWAQAYEALTWSLELSSPSRALRGKQLTAAGHVKRFEAQAVKGGASTLLSQAAVETFRRAADADTASYDPYLGMARIQVYALADVDAAAISIQEAENRGYIPGRREDAVLGDGYLRRAAATRRRADVLTGEQRLRELNNARADYQRCVERFDPIVAFANSAENLEICKAQLEQIDRQLTFVLRES
ncbi:MAG TPA: serine/threonine-protein kinase [Vicinamibacterales bacterium]|nr:serine/threonine-protein kinase [Vicinamibacterales bacterium]